MNLYTCKTDYAEEGSVTENYVSAEARRSALIDRVELMSDEPNVSLWTLTEGELARRLADILGPGTSVSLVDASTDENGQYIPYAAKRYAA